MISMETKTNSSILFCIDCGVLLQNVHGLTKRCSICRENANKINSRLNNKKSANKMSVSINKTKKQIRNVIIAKAKECYGSGWFKPKHISKQLNRQISGLTLASLVKEGTLEKRCDTKSSYYRLVIDKK